LAGIRFCQNEVDFARPPQQNDFQAVVPVQMRMKRGDDEIVMGMLQSGFVLLAARRRTADGVIRSHCACPPGNSSLDGSHSIYGLDADHKRSFSLARTLGLHSTANQISTANTEKMLPTPRNHTSTHLIVESRQAISLTGILCQIPFITPNSKVRPARNESAERWH